MAYWIKTFLCILSLILSTTLSAQSFNDLFSDDSEIFGSEKDEKYAVDAYILQIEKWEGHSSWKFFYFINHKNYPKYQSTRIFPFYYNLHSKIDDRFKKSFLLLYHSKGYNENHYSSQIFPLIRWKVDEEYWNFRLFPFLYMGKIRDSGETKKYFGFFPVGHYSRSPSQKYWNLAWLIHSYRKFQLNGKIRRSISGSPIFFFSKAYGDNGEIERKFNLFLLFANWRNSLNENHGFTIFPFVYYNKKSNRKLFWALAGLIRYSSYHEDSLKKAYSFRALFLYKKYRNDMTDTKKHSLFPLFNFEKRDGSTTSWIFPIYYKDTEKINNDISERNFHTLLWGSSRKYNSSQDTLAYTFWFPFLPIFYKSSDEHNESSHTNLLYLIDWQRNKDTLERVWISPLFFYKKESYLHIFPFYFRTKDINKKQNTSFGIFHYKNLSDETNTLWIWPYYHTENVKKNVSYTHLLPIFYKWKNSESTGDIVFPLWVNYEDDSKSVHVNITGISKSWHRGTLSAELAGGKSGSQYYVDFDFGWFYNLFRFSSRITSGKESNVDQITNLNQKEIIADADVQKPSKTKDRPALVKRNIVSRENSLRFTGYTALFGILSYEKADTKRHFRVLPLSWLTWDEASDNTIKVIPFPLPTVWYKQDEISYKVIFPLYGRQQEGKTFLESWLLIAFLREYQENNNHKSWSLLWPFFNYWQDNGGSGSRAFPLYMYKRKQEGDIQFKKFLSIFYIFTKKQSSEDSFSRHYFPGILPLFYSSDVTVSGMKKNTSWLFPFYYRQSKKSDAESVANVITPLYFTASEKSGNFQSKTIFFYPLLYYKSETNDSSRTSLLLLFHKKRDKNGSSRIGLFPVFTWEKNIYSNIAGNDTSKENSLNIFWLVGYSVSTQTKITQLPNNLLDVQKKQNAKDAEIIETGSSSHTYYFLPLFYSSRFHSISKDKAGLENKNGFRNSYFILGLYYLREVGLSSYTNSVSRINFLWLIDLQKKQRLNKGSDAISNQERHLRLFLGIIHFSATERQKKFDLFYGILARAETEHDYYNYRVLWLGVEGDRKTYRYANFLPVFMYERDKYGSSLLLPPALSYFKKNEREIKQYGVLGLLWYRNKNFLQETDSKKVMLGLLYQETRKKERGFLSRGSLWNFLWKYEEESETGYNKFSAILGLFGRTNKNGETSYKILGVKF